MRTRGREIAPHQSAEDSNVRELLADPLATCSAPRAFGYLVKRLGIKNLHFHDLRHDAASTLTMAGVSQRAVMAMLGNRDPRMTIQYQHLTSEHLHEAARALDTRPHEHAPTGTISAPQESGSA